MLQGGDAGKQRARSLRRSMSLPEIMLWQFLRQKPEGIKFRRQHPSGPYVADFYCHEARLVIEVDGEAHGRGDAPQLDARRDQWFAEKGLVVLRIPATEIMRELNNATTAIMEAAKRRIGED